jgi:hypothetical protein
MKTQFLTRKTQNIENAVSRLSSASPKLQFDMTTFFRDFHFRFSESQFSRIQQKNSDAFLKKNKPNRTFNIPLSLFA